MIDLQVKRQVNPDINLVLVDGPYVILVPADQTSIKIEELQEGLTYRFKVN